ncbi:MAG: penicillin-binding protein activator LpoB [Alphaproteobacteria bacterium]
MNLKNTLAAIFVIVPLAACAETTTKVVSDGPYQHSNTGQETTKGLDNSDFAFAANNAVESFLRSDLSKKPEGGKWILAISRVVNDTTLNIDTDQLVKKIRIALLNSGRVMVTTAVAAGGAEDAMSMQARELRQSDEFNQNTVARKGTLIAPDLSLSGKIIQQANKVGNKQLLEYYFQLSITNLDTGLAYWEFEDVIAKQTGNRDFSW